MRGSGPSWLDPLKKHLFFLCNFLYVIFFSLKMVSILNACSDPFLYIFMTRGNCQNNKKKKYLCQELAENHIKFPFLRVSLNYRIQRYYFKIFVKCPPPPPGPPPLSIVTNPLLIFFRYFGEKGGN